ncbi:two-component system chemotaxis response regulator CheB [Actinoplanes octamycinicus]|uniref:protein-glutamate methylesterase n=1 Tax=Actinoplanes octamycinicus TaxID=135948 RepID=A0A7W7H2L5_9ACTN|nr:chemotaxis protein CheB [Actinoplanes octamycinicus]MBB4742752.1 two-component system chemotaxis response regulator CheB [Actinoplanes octamycinicus]
MPVVALACSAGGLPAIEQILAGLPAGFPGAVIVLRHHDPRTRRDLLTDIRRRSSRLPVESARDGDRLTAGRVLVAPGGFHTLITCEYAVTLVPSGDRPPYRPSADLLLTSMALACGSRAVAVVLSGYGNDGATGATAIHCLGGTVVASDESTSTVFAMPYATISRTEIIDHVVPVEKIADLLTAITADPPPTDRAPAALRRLP